MTLLKKISFFPYRNWWRLGGKTQITNQFGGFCTLIIVVLVGIIFVVKIAEVFNKTKLTVTQTFQQQQYRALYNFTTCQDIPNQIPFMVAIDKQPFDANLNKYLTQTEGDFGFSFQNVYTNTSTNKQQSHSLKMQRCTADHFSKVPNLLGVPLERFVCLPINQTFYFGGDGLYGNFSSVKFDITCKTNACKQQTHILQFYYYFLKATPNPYNLQNPITFGLQRHFIIFTPNTINYNLAKLGLSKILTDNSLLPMEDISFTSFYSPLDNIISQTGPFDFSLTRIQIQCSKGLSYTYQRTYQKLLDAISYIGGIFQSILALFFFIEMFNNSYFQMKFASKYFKCKEAKNFFFGKFLKQSIYNLLHSTRFQPQWAETQVRRKIKEAVVNLQDIVYINRRIDFLEKATSLLFQNHQLKGLRLLNNKTDSEVLKDYKRQKFRDQFIFFLKRKETNSTQSEQCKSNNGNQENKKDKKIGSQNNLDGQTNGIPLESNFQVFQSPQKIIRKEQIRQSPSFESQVKKQAIFEEVEGDEELQQFDNNQSDNLLIEDIQGDLKKLISEAQNDTGDERSKRIYQSMDMELREMLKAVIVQFDGKQLASGSQSIAE